MIWVGLESIKSISQSPISTLHHPLQRTSVMTHSPSAHNVHWANLLFLHSRSTSILVHSHWNRLCVRPQEGRLVYSLYIFLGSIAHDERQPLRRSDLSLEDSSECSFAGKVNFQEKHTIWSNFLVLALWFPLGASADYMQLRVGMAVWLWGQ